MSKVTSIKKSLWILKVIRFYTSGWNILQFNLIAITEMWNILACINSCFKLNFNFKLFSVDLSEKSDTIFINDSKLPKYFFEWTFTSEFFFKIIHCLMWTKCLTGKVKVKSFLKKMDVRIFFGISIFTSQIKQNNTLIKPFQNHLLLTMYQISISSFYSTPEGVVAKHISHRKAFY